MTVSIKRCADKIFAYWESAGSHYIVQGLTQTFNWISLQETDDLFCDISEFVNGDYLELRVLYGFVCSGVFVSQGISNKLSLQNNSDDAYRTITLKYIDSYDGITISFWDDGIYDLYKIFKMVDDVMLPMGSTEDPQITLGIDSDSFVYAEGYVIRDDKQVLVGKSDIVFVKPGMPFAKEDPVLTIVCPVYNAQYFISRTIDSILLSSFKKLCVLLIDDGSTDASPAICDWYAEKYSCVSVIHQENKNRSITRNIGVQCVNTPYMAFIDADDLVHPYMYEKLYDNLIKHDLDISVGQTLIRNGAFDTETAFTDGMEDRLYNYNQYVKAKITHKYSIYYCVVWNHILKTEVAASVPFPDDSYPNQLLPYEDNAYVNALYTWADKIGYCASAYYVYERRQRVTTGTVSTANYSEKYGGFNAHDIYLGTFAYALEKCNPDNKELLELLIAHSVAMESSVPKHPQGVLKKYRDFFDEYHLGDSRYVKTDAFIMNKIAKLRDRIV